MENLHEKHREEEEDVKYNIGRIGDYLKHKDGAGLQEHLNKLINHLPKNVTTLSIPMLTEDGLTVIVAKKESIDKKPEYEEWGIRNLIDYALTLDENYPKR
ncbi:hypothetical protein GX888_03125 [Candidatus Dojkabacteria bacterium]|uniref:Uncharacterized protein n=1 Tax=Candidatus Dojkabacteria bacterium TaxID=2099670 RepID=A0A847VDU3_9BACT|nr:hypothetical protein [Candidatus Dojkabacteria bacterium]